MKVEAFPVAAAVPLLLAKRSFFKLGLAWVLMWIASVHITDEAFTGFLAVYNPTVLAVRSKFGFWPMPTFEFREWLIGLVAAILLLALLSLAFRNTRWLRPLYYFVVVVTGILNGLGHTLGNFRSYGKFHSLPAPGPGFYSSPLLLIVSIYAVVQLRRTRVRVPAV